MGRGAWSALLWGKVTLALATVALAVAGVLGANRPPWLWVVIGTAAFIITHTIVTASRDSSIVRRLGRDYDRVQHCALQIVSDLGQLVGDQYDLWMIDLYLPDWRWRWSKSPPFLKREQQLSRQLSVSLVDARPQPPIVDLAEGPHGESFSTARMLIWFDSKLQVDPTNAWKRYDETTNAGLSQVYGVLVVAPLVDQLGKNCVGVLAVHVKPERNVVLKALGALRADEGQRRIHNACVELNGLLGR